MRGVMGCQPHHTRAFYMSAQEWKLVLDMFILREYYLNMKDKNMTVCKLMNKARAKTRGAALVEFALTFPLLAFVLFAIIQYGFVFSAYMTLRHGAHQTARSLSTAGSTRTSSNATVVACSAISPILDCNNLQAVQVQSNVINSANTIQVSLSYNLPLIIPWVVPNNQNGQVVLTSQAVYRTN